MRMANCYGRRNNLAARDIKNALQKAFAARLKHDVETKLMCEYEKKVIRDRQELAAIFGNFK